MVYVNGENGKNALVQEEEIKNESLELLLQEIERLSSERKAQLLSKLLDKELAMDIFLGNSHNNHVMHAEIVLQFNGVSPELIKILVDALAERIKKCD